MPKQKEPTETLIVTVRGRAPLVQKQPSDIFSTEIFAALDGARQEIADIGLRPYRTFLIIDKYDGERRKDGDLIERQVDEILPPPEVRFFSTAKVAFSAGQLQDGDAMLTQISRSLTKEHLRGRNLAGGPFPKHWHFRIALRELGAIHAEFYQPSSAPQLEPTFWSMNIRPENKRGPLITTPEK